MNVLSFSNSYKTHHVQSGETPSKIEKILSADYFLRYIHQDPKAAPFFIQRLDIKRNGKVIELSTECSPLGSLSDLIESSPTKSLSLKQIARMIKWVAAALSFLEKEGISYPNLSDKKIIFFNDEVKLTNFREANFEDAMPLALQASILELAEIATAAFIPTKSENIFDFSKVWMGNEPIFNLINQKAQQRNEDLKETKKFSTLLLKMLNSNFNISLEDILSDPFLSEIQIPDPSPSLPKLPDLDGEFISEKKIGNGAFGSVISAQLMMNGNLNGTYAIKSPRSQKKRESEGIQSILDEDRFLRLLSRDRNSTRYIVKRESLFRENEQVHLVLELAKSDLKQYSKQVNLSLKDIRQIGKHLFEALDFLFTQNVIHLDIKPQNILIREDGTPVLADFGLAAFHERATHYFHFDVATPFYRPPENCLKAPFTAAVDIWSLGATLVEAFSKDILFEARNTDQIIQLHHARIGPYPTSLLKKASKEIQKKYQRISSPNENLFTRLLKRLTFPKPIKELSEFIKDRSYEEPDIEPFIDLIRRTLTLDAEQRPTAEELLKHKFFETN